MHVGPVEFFYRVQDIYRKASRLLESHLIERPVLRTNLILDNRDADSNVIYSLRIREEYFNGEKLRRLHAKLFERIGGI